MDALLQSIRECRTIADFISVYDSTPFQTSLQRLTAWLARKPDPTPVEAWAETWAHSVAAGDPDALTLNLDRKACLQLLYSLCDCWRPKDGEGAAGATVSDADIVDGFKDRRVSNILGPCVVMDRAQALYVMRIPGAAAPGMHWYAEKHAEEGEWRKRLEGYEGWHTMNKRILWLVEDLNDRLGLNHGAMKRWIQPEPVPGTGE